MIKFVKKGISWIRSEHRHLVTMLDTQKLGRVGVSYALRTISAALISDLLCRVLGLYSPVWAVVSAIVVIMPEHRASINTAGIRVIANIVGAAIGSTVVLLGFSSLVSLTIGLAAVTLICRLLTIDGATRSAGVALALVILKAPGEPIGFSEQRVAQVMIGCVVAFAVTVAAVRIEKE